MKQVMKFVKDTMKVLIIFVLCTSFFYVALRMVHEEYERFHRYDEPQGTAVKVFNQEQIDWTERLSIFFQLGE
ncbi:DUF4227 family protein [Thalassobacillus pellis]|uniref:DUF4227 family protein n=1 Tax=Thalassobacillus pellis TaxID=748008 RepID=UPI0019612A23|nr:DUF4227 family protein [Thalassobacillus pellis]MBM7552390.1 hypothetical protein [Thalassobacillus pellis]